MAELSRADLIAKMLEAAYLAQEGHLPSALSVLDIISVLHTKIMAPEDRFILSKGHASLALYAVLGAIGKIPTDWPSEFCHPDSALKGHPCYAPEHGIEATTGSLGHGVCLSVGMALGKRILGVPGRIYCLVGDQELGEGSCWEAMLLANKFKLTNLTWVIDDNQTAEGSLSVDSIGAKFLAFNWHVETCSGHSETQLAKALKATSHLRPTCLIANTIKGFGLGRMQTEPRVWHHKAPSRAECEDFVRELYPLIEVHA